MANGCLAADLGIGHSFTAARLTEPKAYNPAIPHKRNLDVSHKKPAPDRSPGVSWLNDSLALPSPKAASKILREC
ncbi:MAG TPA: hypothetical protein PLY87_24355, partial [Planctomycetaceae bacterium]|nr:hypothetical protein [Planctomycetaceae bacterium]